MFYQEKKEKVMVTAKDIYGFKKTAVKERWRGVACSEIREEVEVLYGRFGPRARKQYRITEVNT